MSLKNHGKRWEPYDDERLLETYRKKLQEAPCVEMALQWTAVAIGRSRNSVQSRLAVLRWNGEDI